MKKFFILVLSSLTTLFWLSAAMPADSVQRRPSAVSSRNTASQPATTLTRTKTTTARSGVSALPARSAVSTPAVTARAATIKQNAIQSGTTIASSTNSYAFVNAECKEMYYGCMDSFCMIDNDNGGRCVCSDQKEELDSILAQIEQLDSQSYKLATEGVERLELGNNANAIFGTASNAQKSIESENSSVGRKRIGADLDLSMWDNVVVDDYDAFVDSSTEDISDKTGADLYSAANALCVAQIQGCDKDMRMLQTMYGTNIRSDCRAYENTLNKKKQESERKLLAAQKALRDAALGNFQTSNKWDLGQCTIQFKSCMANTAGCKNDFTGCVGIAAAENAKVSSSGTSTSKTTKIKGATTYIEIAASTLDALESKKPICESVTDSCLAVKDDVWNTFLREVAPTIKTAELLAESNLRTSCIANISTCFQKACRDNIDPNDPDGSYDMCLTRPDTLRSLCKVEIDPCESAEPAIMDFVRARLAGMRVDSCTSQVKKCLTADTVCGEDYTSCIGLDTDTIIKMCPYDKLVGCQKVYGDEDIQGDSVYANIENMITGIMLSIDNNAQKECQNALDASMIKVCGDTENCDGLIEDDALGAKSLSYKICKYSTTGLTTPVPSIRSINAASSISVDVNGNCRTSADQITDAELRDNEAYAAVLDGTIYWDLITVGEDGKLDSVDDYVDKVESAGIALTDDEEEEISENVVPELRNLQNAIDSAIALVESDSKVGFCINGRSVQGLNTAQGARQQIGSAAVGGGRFPNLTRQMRISVATHVLNVAKQNYQDKYDKLNQKMLSDYALVAERIAEIAEKDEQSVRRESARQACINLASNSIVPSDPTKSVTWMLSTKLAPLTGGLSLLGLNNIDKNYTGRTSTGSISDYSAAYNVSEWNYKAVVNTKFIWDTGVCNRCIREQRCEKEKRVNSSSRYCKKWAEETETCKDIQF